MSDYLLVRFPLSNGQETMGILSDHPLEVGSRITATNPSTIPTQVPNVLVGEQTEPSTLLPLAVPVHIFVYYCGGSMTETILQNMIREENERKSHVPSSKFQHLQDRGDNS